MALTTKESAHLLRIEQMTHIIVQKNGELLYQDEGYKDFSVIGNMSEINVSVFKLEKGYQYYKKNIGRTIRAFEDLDVELLEDFDNKLVGIIKQYEIPLELKSVEELTDLIYGFPNQEYRDVNNTFSFIWGFLNEVQRHDLIAKYAEYTGWKFLRYRSGILCGAVYGLGVGLVNTVKALWDLIIMLYNFEAAYLGQLKDHFIDLRGSLEDDLKWLEHSSNIIATVSKSIFDDPGIILEFFSAIWEMFNGFIDSTTAEWMEKEPFDQGISVGTNIGQGLFEIIIAVIGTKGVDKVAKLAKSGKFVALLEKMNLGRLNKLISKVDELKKLKAASTGLSKMDGLVLSTNGKERVVDLLTEFDNVDDVIAKLSKLGNDFPQIVDKLTDTDELTRFISKIDNLEADKLDELTNIINHLDDYPNVTIDDIITQDIDNIITISNVNIDKSKVFTDNDEVLRWTKETFSDWFNSLTHEQVESFRAYTGDEHYEEINAFLRGFTNEISEVNVNHISNLSKALELSSIPESVTVYRGTVKAALGAYKDLPADQLVGKIIYDNAFMSTSLIEGGSFDTPVKLVIEVQRGSKGAYVGNMSTYEMEELELLLNKALLT